MRLPLCDLCQTKLGARTIMANSKRSEVQEKYMTVSHAFPKVAGIDAPTLKRWLDDPVTARHLLLVDVRTPEEWGVSVLPGNTLPVQELELDLEKYRGSTIVTYCTIGARSGQYADKLQSRGFTVYNLEGSIAAWTQEGYALVCGSDRQTPSTRVHMWSDAWAAYAGTGYQVVTFKAPLWSTAVAALKGWVGRGGR